MPVLPRRARSTRTFLERERIGQWTAAVFCMNDDARNLYGAVLAKAPRRAADDRAGARPDLREVYERGGVDVAINPRQVTAEEMVRFAHDPRCRQVAMLEDDRFEVLDITVQAGVRAGGQARSATCPRPAR